MTVRRNSVRFALLPFLFLFLATASSLRSQVLSIPELDSQPAGVIEEGNSTWLNYYNESPTWGWIRVRCTATLDETFEEVVFDTFFIYQYEGTPLGGEAIDPAPSGALWVDVEVIQGFQPPFPPSISVPVVPGANFGGFGSGFGVWLRKQLRDALRWI